MENPLFQWPFSIVMFNYQKVTWIMLLYATKNLARYPPKKIHQPSYESQRLATQLSTLRVSSSVAVLKKKYTEGHYFYKDFLSKTSSYRDVSHFFSYVSMNFPYCSYEFSRFSYDFPRFSYDFPRFSYVFPWLIEPFSCKRQRESGFERHLNSLQ